MHLASPAKINLHLRVGRKAADGFHPLLSWMCTVGLADTLELRPIATPDVVLTCDRPDLPLDKSNLVLRAADALAQATSSAHGAAISLQKNIPMGGGLGGGSSNAAHTLLALNEFWNLHLPRQRLSEIAAPLGSDVPFFLHGPSSICRGRGQRVVPIARPWPGYVVLIFPDFSMPTPAVYRRFDEMRLGSDDAITRDPDWLHWTTLPALQLLPLLVNDLEAPTFSLRDELGQLREKIESAIGRIVRMSGSGSTLFTLADDEEEADDLAARIRDLAVEARAFELTPGGSKAIMPPS